MKKILCMFLCFTLILSLSVSAFAANEYTAVNYVEQPKKDGTTLALFHFDGDTKDSSGNGVSLDFSNVPHSFIRNDSAVFVDHASKNVSLRLPEPLSGDFTIEGIGTFIGVPNENEYIRKKLTGGTNISFEGVVGNTFDTFISDEEARSIVEARLGTGGTYNSKGVVNGWDYTVEGPFYRLCGGSSFINLATDKLMAANLYAYSHPSAKARYYGNTYTGFESSVDFSLSDEYETEYFKTMTTDISVPFSIVRSGDTVTYYEYGKAVWSDSSSASSKNLTLSFLNGWNIILDELRISNKALYTSDYTPSDEAFSMETYFAPPESGTVNQIAVNSAVPVASLTMGDVAPEAPAEGDLFVNVRYEHIKEVQQYQGGEWTPVEASIYTDGNQWVKAAGYDIGPDNAVDYTINAVSGVFSFFSVLIAFILSQPVLLFLLAACLLPVVIAIFRALFGLTKRS